MQSYVNLCQAGMRMSKFSHMWTGLGYGEVKIESNVDAFQVQVGEVETKTFSSNVLAQVWAVKNIQVFEKSKHMKVMGGDCF